MGQEPSRAVPGIAPGERTPEQIQAEIEHTRRELGHTVAAVAEKADVKSQARRRMDEAKQTVQARREQLIAKTRTAGTPGSSGAGMQEATARARENPVPLAVGGALLLGYLFGRRTRR